MPRLTIDGKKVKVKEGTTILQAAEQLGINIPTLCYHKALLPYGACRLCLVEIFDKNASTIRASCTYPALDGLVVKTNTERVIKNRKIMAELLLARCPEIEQVKKVAADLGVTKTRIKPKHDDCILCGLCVRMCEQRMGRQAISFAGRGPRREVASPFSQPSEVCQVCGACDFVCPTGKKKLEDYCKNKPVTISSEYNEGLISRPAVYIPYPQAIPNKAKIDSRYCVHLLRGECQVCVEFCEADAIDFNQKQEELTVEVGAIVLSPGFNLYNIEKQAEYGYLKYANVITSIELERILSASGPFGGHVVRPSDHSPPQKVAFIQCVGSRDSQHHYCSAVCCMYAIKEAIIAREHDNNIGSTVFYMDVRTHGKDFERYYERAKNEYEVKFKRARIADIVRHADSDDLEIQYENEQGYIDKEVFQLVVLSIGFMGNGHLRKLGDSLGLPINRHGFIATEHYNSVETKVPGIFACGPAQEPKDIPETVTQASAAAGAVAEILANSRFSQIKEKIFPQERDVSKETQRIGVFICHCGINIGGIVDVPQVVEYARSLPHVEYAERNLYTCSQDTQRNIIDIIKKHKLNRVVVASCTPRTHEPLFQETIREAGLNPHLFTMANIRDQCSWIHMKMPLEATAKARDLVKMAVAKAALLKPLPSILLDITQSALVIGGGAAGMSAALSLARQGFQVHLVEKEKQLGGNLLKVHYSTDGRETILLLARMIREIEDNTKIKVYFNSQVKESSGFVGNYKTILQGQNGRTEEIEHGVVIIATGAQESVPDEYQYKKDKRVKTGQEFENLLKQENGAQLPDNVVFIQCVGSREEDHMYCSRLCCSETIKNAILLKQKNSAAQVTVLYRDVRTYGFLESYYEEAREAGVLFLCYDAEQKPQVSKNGKGLVVTVKDLHIMQQTTIHPDMIVLASRIDPNPSNEELSQLFKVPLNRDGFFLEAHVKLRPVDFATEGVFLAGMAHNPKNLVESMAQGRAAAARAATIISKEKIEANATIASVDENICIGCGICVSGCAYNALSLQRNKDGVLVSTVNQVMCKGCGSCASACPSGAMDQKGFLRGQIFAEIDAVLSD